MDDVNGRSAVEAELRARLARLRGTGVPPRPLDARALAALAANPGCGRRALLDAAGVDKAAVARALGAPARFGQSQFAFARGNAFESRVTADGCAELLRLLGAGAATGDAGDPSEPQGMPAARLPDLSAAGPQGRAARTRLALREAAGAGGWTLLHHPLLELDVAGSPAYLEPDAVAVAPDGSWTVIEIKSFPILDGGADPAKVGAAARQAAVYVLALERLEAAAPRSEVLLVCPRDFSNVPVGEWIDVRPQLAVTRRQLARLTRVERIATALPADATLAVPEQDGSEEGGAGALAATVESVPAAYLPECLDSCELAYHCRDRSRAAGGLAVLGRPARAELGTLSTVAEVLAAARPGTGADPDPGAGDGSGGGAGAEDPAAAALRRAAALRAEALCR